LRTKMLWLLWREGLLREVDKKKSGWVLGWVLVALIAFTKSTMHDALVCMSILFFFFSTVSEFMGFDIRYPGDYEDGGTRLACYERS
jgi:hypothetical protein